MAVSDTPKRGGIGPSLRGLIYQYERQGQWITSNWPRKRGKKATPKQKLAQEAFRGMMAAMKGTAAEIQTYHRLNAKGTPMLPRDTLMAALYGNGPTIVHYSGKVIKPMSNRIMSSTVLDALGWAPGTILFRGPELWEPLPQGLEGQVLTSQGESEMPVWVTPESGGGGGGSAYFPGNSEIYVSSRVAFMTRIVPTMNMEIHRGWTRVGLAGTYGIRMEVWHATSGVLDALIATSPYVRNTVGIGGQFECSFDVPAAMARDQEYFLAFVRDPAESGGFWQSNFSNGVNEQRPWYNPRRCFQMTVQPAVGLAPTDDGAGMYFTALAYGI